MIRDERVVLIEDVPIGVSAYTIKRYVPHWHENCLELVFVLRGSLNIVASYDRFSLHEGDCMAINAGDVHYLYGDENNLVFILHIQLSAFKTLYPYIFDLDFICESFNANSLQTAHVGELKKLMVRVIVEALRDEESDEKTWEILHEIMELLIGKFDMIHYYSVKDIPEDQLGRYRRIMKIIQSECTGKISIEKIAEGEYIGKTYLSQFWKKLTNMNFTEYVNSRRCEIAEKMLLTTGKSINEISVDCGFSDTKYIYRSFKKWYDDTPSGYRDRMLEYQARGNSFKEYERTGILAKFSKTLLDSLMDDENMYLLHSAGLDEGWKEKLEKEISKYLGSRVKKEMVRESHKAGDLKELYMPLADSSVIEIDGDELGIDEKIIDDVFRIAEELDYDLCIEINFEERTAEEWFKAISALVQYAQRKKPEIMEKCRLCVYFGGFEKDWEVKALKRRLRGLTGYDNIRIAMRFN